VVTARVHPPLINKLQLLLGERGRIYLKPFNDLLLENDLAVFLGLESQVPPIFLPKEYAPPSIDEVT
jgi:hypothetical protein